MVEHYSLQKTAHTYNTLQAISGSSQPLKLRDHLGAHGPQSKIV